MSDTCLSYVSPRPSKPSAGFARWNKWRISDVCRFLARETGEGWLPSHFLRRKLFNETHTYQSVWIRGKQQIKEATARVMVGFCSRCKWGDTCSNASGTFTLLQIIVNYQRLWSCRFPKANCKTFKTSFMLDGTEFKTIWEQNGRNKDDEVWLSGNVCAGGCFWKFWHWLRFPNNQPTE